MLIQLRSCSLIQLNAAYEDTTEVVLNLHIQSCILIGCILTVSRNTYIIHGYSETVPTTYEETVEWLVVSVCMASLVVFMSYWYLNLCGYSGVAGMWSGAVSFVDTVQVLILVCARLVCAVSFVDTVLILVCASLWPTWVTKRQLVLLAPMCFTTCIWISKHTNTTEPFHPTKLRFLAIYLKE